MSGRPICAKCGLVGHMHRDCRRRGNFSENRSDSFQNRKQQSPTNPEKNQPLN